ncbi:MAG: hypothetical protein J7K32_06700 [Deltaproteobacteria bacterium]|nr:hypothetical protein [Deltaproteobacteria bacterium]
MGCNFLKLSVFFIDFEDGTDGAYINDITGVTFEDAFGHSSICGDSSTGSYNTTSDDLGYGTGFITIMEICGYGLDVRQTRKV